MKNAISYLIFSLSVTAVLSECSDSIPECPDKRIGTRTAANEENSCSIRIELDTTTVDYEFKFEIK